jgi:DNA invertase Pin-like site-specific DNA recombinase
MFNFMAGIRQFERDSISQRTREGLEATRTRGKQGGRKPKLDADKKKAIYELYQQKRTTVKDLCDMFNITKPTLYKIIEEISTNNSTGVSIKK